MRDFRGILEAMLVVVMVCAVPAVSMGALMFDRPTQTEYNEVVDELVQVTADCETAEAVAVDKRHDAVAIGVAVGGFIASGGAGVVIKLLFPICALVPFL